LSDLLLGSKNWQLSKLNLINPVDLLFTLEADSSIHLIEHHKMGRFGIY